MKVIFLIALIACVLILAPMAEGKKQSYTDVYHYHIQFDLPSIHNRIIETGFQDLCIGVQLYEIVDNSGNPAITIDELLDEIRWAKKVAKGNGSVGLFIYNDTTRVGYDMDYIYRYYRDWGQRIPVYEAIANSGIDYFLIVSRETHYSSLRDITTFLLAQRGIIEEKRIRFGVYDGDGFCDLLDYSLLESIRVSICSDIYMDWSEDMAFLRSPCGWDYDYLITYCWLGKDKLIQNKQAIDAVHRLLREQEFTGYNLLCTYDYEGIMPDWVLL